MGAACSCPTVEPSAPGCHVHESWNDIDNVTLGDWDVAGHVTSAMEEFCADSCPDGGEVCETACSCPIVAPGCHAHEEWNDIDDVTLGDWNVAGHMTSAISEYCADSCPDGGEYCEGLCS